MKLMMERWLTGEALGGWPILFLAGEENFLFLIMIGGDYPTPGEYRMKVKISSFSEILDF